MFFQPNNIPAGSQIQVHAPTTPWAVTFHIKRPLNSNGMSVSDYAAGVREGTHNVLTREEFASSFGANQADINVVTSYVHQVGATVDLIHSTASIVVVSGTVGLFNSEFGIQICSVTTNQKTYPSYSGTATIPTELADIVVHVSGLDHSYEPVAKDYSSISNTPSSIFGNYNTPIGSPQAAATAYKFPGRNNGTDGSGQVVGLIEPFGSCGYTQANLNSTFGGFGLAVPNVVEYLYSNNPFFTVINDPSQSASAEVMLDIAAVGGIVPKATTVVYITDSLLNAMLASLHDVKNLGYFPSILSFSFASAAPYYGSTFDEATTLGVTLVVAAGDWGPYTLPAGNALRSVDVPFPAADLNSLAVGGTSLAINLDGSRASEVTWNDGYDYAISGGGQSSRVSVPSWQASLTLKDYATGNVTTLTGRGTPDVAFNADGGTGFPVYWSLTNSAFPANGTSSAAPHWAGLIARINEAIGNNVGFITSSLYSHPEAFNDITVGDNNENGIGYSATTGWDAATGLGTPIGLKVLAALGGGANLPSDNTLSALTVTDNLGNTITLSPTFNSGTLDYTGRVGSNVTSVSITPTTNDPAATLSVNGNNATSGQPVTVSL